LESITEGGILEENLFHSVFPVGFVTPVYWSINTELKIQKKMRIRTPLKSRFLEVSLNK